MYMDPEGNHKQYSPLIRFQLSPWVERVILMDSLSMDPMLVSTLQNLQSLEMLLLALYTGVVFLYQLYICQLPQRLEPSSLPFVITDLSEYFPMAVGLQCKALQILGF